MKEGISPVYLIALSLWIAFSTSTSAETARVAVAGAPSLANLVDVTSAELSKSPDLAVLDRADLDKLGP